MNDDFLEQLYVTGELERDYIGVNDLIEQYKQLFPDIPLPRSFYELDPLEELAQLEEAINFNTPITGKQKRL